MASEPGVDADFDRVVFQTPALTVGSFRADPAHPRFADSGPAAHHLFVFPRTAVAIQHEGGAPFVAGPPIVTFYNRGQRYRRQQVSRDGDRCEWFALSPRLLAGLSATRADIEDDGAPFAYSHGPSDSAVYLRQRQFVERCLSATPPDGLTGEETCLALAARVTTLAAGAWHQHDRGALPRLGAKDRDVAEAAKVIVFRRFRDALTLADIAHAVDCTPFRLCRAFKAVTGWSLHRFRDEVRLRVALEEVRGRSGDLTDVALSLGYSSHSHFTASFSRAFGVPPSQWQRLPAAAGDGSPWPPRDGRRR